MPATRNPVELLTRMFTALTAERATGSDAGSLRSGLDRVCALRDNSGMVRIIAEDDLELVYRCSAGFLSTITTDAMRADEHPAAGGILSDTTKRAMNAMGRISTAPVPTPNALVEELTARLVRLQRENTRLKDAIREATEALQQSDDADQR